MIRPQRETWEKVSAPKNPTRTTRKQRERIIAVLENAEKPLSQAEIAERANVPVPVVCRALKRMIQELFVIRLGYKYEPHNPYRYVMNGSKALEIITPYFSCPICNSKDFEHVTHRIDCKNCKECIILYCLQVLDPDDFEAIFLRQSYTQRFTVSEDEPNKTVNSPE